MFKEEHAFLRQLEDILTRCTTNEELSDSMKQMFSTEVPFEAGQFTYKDQDDTGSYDGLEASDLFSVRSSEKESFIDLSSVDFRTEKPGNRYRATSVLSHHGSHN
jgi:hypothetical protein